MQIKDIKLLDESIQALPKVKRDKDRFIVSLSLDLSEEQLRALGLKPRTRKRGDDVKKPTTRELIEKLTINMNERFDKVEAEIAEMKSTPTMKKELAKPKDK